MKSYPKLRLATGFALLCIISFGCKKNNDPGWPYFITWGKVAGQVSFFLSDNSQYHKYPEHWDFGDGDTLIVTGAPGSPFDTQRHVYKAPGIYAVTLMVNNDASRKVTILDTILWPQFKIYNTGIGLPDSPLYFYVSPTPPSGSTYLWSFGDGTNATDAVPYHAYQTTGAFHVQLTINHSPSIPDVQTTMYIQKDPVYTHQMVNTRLWHVVEHVYNSTRDFTLTIDSSFALNYVDELTISFYKYGYYYNFGYNPSLSSGDIITFSNTKDFYKTSTITYNHLTDSMSISTFKSYQDAPRTEPYNVDITWHSP